MKSRFSLTKPWVLATVGSAIMLSLVALGFGLARGGSSSGFSDQLTQLMGIAPMGGAVAPDFTLVDQNGQTSSLSDLRGHPVVLEFFDSVCTDICPIISADFLNAAQQLGSKASNVIFAAVNVNAAHNGVSDVAAFTKQHSLDTLPHWHFFTGSTSTLQKVWSDYGISVYTDSSGDVKHQDWMFFIDSNGREQWLASPDATASETQQWGSGIATIVKTLR